VLVTHTRWAQAQSLMCLHACVNAVARATAAQAVDLIEYGQQQFVLKTGRAWCMGCVWPACSD
jgi:hypothetical protein